jgi:hypothetical protein
LFVLSQKRRRKKTFVCTWPKKKKKKKTNVCKANHEINRMIYMATLHECENICLYSAKKEEERKHLFVIGQKRRRKRKQMFVKLIMKLIA